LIKPLSKLGMRRAFDSAAAEFQRLTTKKLDLYIAAIRQKAFIELQEEGTEAAAVTVKIVEAKKEEPKDQPKVFRADHPFLFLIRDTKTARSCSWAGWRTGT